MASSLILEFTTSNGDTKSVTFANADPEASNTSIRQLAAGIVANSSSLLRETFTAAKSAVIRTTTDREVNLNS